MNTQTIEVKHLPVVCNIDLVAGDDYAMELTIRLDGTLLPWAGVTPTYAIRTPLDAAPPSNVNWTVATPSAGIIQLSLTAANTTALGMDTYNWWLALTINSKKRTYIKGRMRLIDQVSMA